MAGFFAPNRIAVYLTSLLALIVGLTAILGDLDWTSVVGMLGSLTLILGVVIKWLDGWQKHESREAGVAIPVSAVLALEPDAAGVPAAAPAVVTAEGLMLETPPEGG